MSPTFGASVFLLIVCMLGGRFFAGASGAAVGAFASVVVTVALVAWLGR